MNKSVCACDIINEAVCVCDIMMNKAVCDLDKAICVFDLMSKAVCANIRVRENSELYGTRIKLRNNNHTICPCQSTCRKNVHICKGYVHACSKCLHA